MPLRGERKGRNVGHTYSYDTGNLYLRFVRKQSRYFTTSVVLTCNYVKAASVTVNIYQVELALVVVVSCFSRPSVLQYEHTPHGENTGNWVLFEVRE